MSALCPFAAGGPQCQPSGCTLTCDPSLYASAQREKNALRAYRRSADAAFQVSETAVPVPLPFGFITCPESQTSISTPGPLDVIFSRWDKEARFYALRRYYLSHPSELAALACDFVPVSSSTIGFKVRTYKSGECSGTLFHTGRDSRIDNLGRCGELETTELTQYGRTKIRRAVECSDNMLRYFWTFTFSPDHCPPWTKNADGTIRHDFAKYKLKKFLDTCRHKQSRLKRQLSYIWVAEIQTKTTNNIHFHILLDQFFDVKYMVRIWAQASNSVDIATPLKNVGHVANYISKYMQKDTDTAVKGFRYCVSSTLQAATQPKEQLLMSISKKDNNETDGETVKSFLETIDAMREEIETGGGTVFDYGYHIARPRSGQTYKDKKTGEEKRRKAVSPLLAKHLIHLLDQRTNTVNVPF